jgi:hypothetical protein
MPIEPDTILRGSVPPRQLASDASVFDKRFIITSELTMNESENVGDQLQATENVLRNLIASILSDKLGGEWLVKTGVSQDRYDGWVRKREAEKKKLATGNLETRLLYFADFYDLKTIIVKNWGHFSAVFGERKEFEVFLSNLEDFRNPNAHARGLLPYQEHLALGICGEIRAKVARYRSKKETAKDCFPRIDSAYDNHGHTYPFRGIVSDRVEVRPGDRVEVVVHGSDPEGLPLEYQFKMEDGPEQIWSTINAFTFELTSAHIGMLRAVRFYIRFPRNYHAYNTYDHVETFLFDVLPLRS